MLWHLWNPVWQASSLPRQEPKRPALESLLIQSLLKHSSTAACLLDTQGHCVQMTPNFHAVTGLEISQCYQHGLLQHFSDEDRAQLLAICAETTAQQQPQQWVLEQKNDDATRMQEWTLMPNGDDAQHVLLLVRDITETYHAELQTMRAQLQAQLADRQRSDFLANMSHELRTPLNAILGFAQMMEHQIFGRITNPTYREYVEKIQESGNELLQKINDLLQIASLMPEAATEPSAHSFFCINTLVRELIEQNSHAAFQRDITLIPVLLDTAPQLYGDRLHIKQALQHVLNNAIKFGRERGTVRVVGRAGNDGRLKLQCIDNGPGISAKQLHRIHEGLARPLLERGRDDIGLGLAVATHYLQRHGATLHITSNPAHGTTVSMDFPAHALQWNKPEAAQNPARKKQRSTSAA